MVDSLADFSRVSPAGPTFQVGSPSYVIACTQPEFLLRHDISDEELEMLIGGRREDVRDAMWTAIGVAAGAAPAGLCALIGYVGSYSEHKTAPIMTGVDLVQIILLFVAVVSAVGAHLAIRRKKGEKPLEDCIRERTRRNAGATMLRE